MMVHTYKTAAFSIPKYSQILMLSHPPQRPTPSSTHEISTPALASIKVRSHPREIPGSPNFEQRSMQQAKAVLHTNFFERQFFLHMCQGSLLRTHHVLL